MMAAARHCALVLCVDDGLEGKVVLERLVRGNGRVVMIFDRPFAFSNGQEEHREEKDCGCHQGHHCHGQA